MMLALSGCALYAGGDGGGGGGQGGGGGEGGGGGGTISFLHWRGEDVAIFDEIIADFTEETGIRVNQQALPSDAYQTQLQATLLSGEGADVFATMPGAQFTELAEADAYVPLQDEEWAGRFRDEFIAAGAQGENQFSYPYQLVFNIPVYNRGLMEQAGLNPDEINDWDGFLRMCDTLKQRDVAPIAFAGDISPSQFINPMLMNNQPNDDIWTQVLAGEARVTDEWFVRTMSQLAELRDRDCFQRDPLGSTDEGATALFAGEDAAMLAMGSYKMATINDQNPDIEQGLLAPITVPADQKKYDGVYTSTFMLGVSKDSQNQDAAKQFIEYLTRPEPAARYANGTGQLLTLDEVEYNSPATEAQIPWLDRELLFQPRYQITNPDVAEGLETTVTDVMGGMSAEEAAQKYQDLFDRSID